MRPDNAELAFNDPHQRGVLWMHTIGAWEPVAHRRGGDVSLGTFDTAEAAMRALHEAMDYPPDIALPEGWTWDMVKERRRRWSLGREMVPVGNAPGCTAWGHVNFERKYGRAPAQQEVAL